MSFHNSGELLEMECCGTREFYGVNDSTVGSPENMLLHLAWQYHSEENRMAHVIINEVEKTGHFHYIDDAVRHAGGMRKIVEEHKLGQWVSSVARKNPNSGNTIRSHIYSPAWSALLAWARKQPAWREEIAAQREARREYLRENHRWYVDFNRRW